MRDITGPNGQSAGSQSFGDMSRGGLAEQLTPLVMAGMTGAGLYGAFGGAGGLGGFGGAGGEAASLGAGVTSGAADSIGAYLAANPVNMASLTAGIPEISAITAAAGGAAAGAAIPTLTSGAAESLAAYSAANPVTVAQLGAGIPDIASITAAGASAASLQSIRAAEHANMGQAAGNIPKTVNMGGLGGTTATAGGLQGLLDVGSQGLADATASSQIGGTAASQLGQAANSGIGSIASGAGDVAGFMKSNPMLGKLLFSGALGALASSGGVSSAGAPKTYGAPVQWNSPLRSNGLLGGQQAPQAQQSMPGGLLGTGQANDGAWRWMKG